MSLLFFDELLDAPDFVPAVEKLAAEFRGAHGLGGVQELGLVTPDILKCATALEARGMGPFMMGQGSPAYLRERADDRTFTTRVGFAFYKDILIEIAEPGTGSDLFREALDPAGRTTVEHVGMFVDDAKAAAAPLAEYAWIEAQVDFFPYTITINIVDTAAKCGVALEFLEVRLFGQRSHIPQAPMRWLGQIQRALGLRILRL